MKNAFRILVVDDNKAILRVYQSALNPSRRTFKTLSLNPEKNNPNEEKLVFEPVFCIQAESAVDTVRKSLRDRKPFSVVFMDLNLSTGRNGIWAAKMIRKLDQYIEIVIVTGHYDRNPALISSEIQPLHKLLYLEKPLHMWEIAQFAAALSKKWQNERKLVQLKNHLKGRVTSQHEEIVKTNEQLKKEIHTRMKAEASLNISVDNLRQAFAGIVRLITSMIETRDPYTAGHQSRVADLARSIAVEMQIPPKTIEGIRMAATVHDLGKISIPSDILNKPGRLTDIEMMLLRNHVQIGYDLLKDITFPWPVASIIYQHHEKMDGSGYPNGLKDNEIMLEAKILIVADVVEAMQSRRPYRSSLGLDNAMNEIINGRGKLYDSDVVDVCLKLFNEKKFIFKN